MMVSEPLKVDLPNPLDELLKNREKLNEIVEYHQEKLKEIGDWKIFPRTIELISEGRVAFDDKKRVYVDGNPVPYGYREDSLS